MIQKVILKNFKIHKHTEIVFDQMLSILTGENNSGKTSLLEALLIFQECYNSTLHKIARSNSSSVRDRILKVGDYDFRDRYIATFHSVRSEDYYELFHQNTDTFEINVTLKIEDKFIEIKFKVEKARSETAYHVIPSIDASSLQNLNEFNPEQFIFFIKSSPISSIVRNEPFYTPKMLEKYIFENSNLLIMRNRLLKIKNQNKLLELQSQIAYILDLEGFELDINYNMNKDLYIEANFTTKKMQEYQDIALLGSGTLQIIEVLISLNLESTHSVRVALLDEPDSHLHRKLQSQLLFKLREISHNGIQIIITTHNEQIVSSAKLEEILHMYLPNTRTGRKIEVKPVVSSYQHGRMTGFLKNTNKHSIYASLGISTAAMNVLEAIESDKVILIEGASDALFIEALQHKRASLFPISQSNRVSFWSLNGIDDLPNKLKYWKSILENISNEVSIWSKCIVVLDLDCLSLNEASEVSRLLQSEYHVEVLFWNSYTIESIILSNLQGFANAFAMIFGLDKVDVFDKTNTFLQTKTLSSFRSKIDGQRQARAKTYEYSGSQILKLYDGKQHNEYINFLENVSLPALYLYGKNEIYDLLDYLIDFFQIKSDYIEKQDLVLDILLAYDGGFWDSKWTEILKKIYG